MVSKSIAETAGVEVIDKTLICTGCKEPMALHYGPGTDPYSGCRPAAIVAAATIPDVAKTCAWTNRRDNPCRGDVAWRIIGLEVEAPTVLACNVHIGRVVRAEAADHPVTVRAETPR